MDVIDKFNAVMVENGIEPSTAERISESVRLEFCSDRFYIPKKSKTCKERIETDIKNNIPREKIAKKYQISAITVWRMSKKIMGSRK